MGGVAGASRRLRALPSAPVSPSPPPSSSSPRLRLSAHLRASALMLVEKVDPLRDQRLPSPIPRHHPVRHRVPTACRPPLPWPPQAALTDNILPGGTSVRDDSAPKYESTLPLPFPLQFILPSSHNPRWFSGACSAAGEYFFLLKVPPFFELLTIIHSHSSEHGGQHDNSLELGLIYMGGISIGSVLCISVVSRRDVHLHFPIIALLSTAKMGGDDAR